jgi:toxin YoeB
VVTWNLAYSKFALKDAKKLSAAGLKDKAQTLLNILEIDPLQNSPPYEKLVGDLKGAYSRRINIQHRLIYEILRKEKTVRILRMWTHYQ